MHCSFYYRCNNTLEFVFCCFFFPFITITIMIMNIITTTIIKTITIIKSIIRKTRKQNSNRQRIESER